jgi:hypothetical protein
LDVFIASLTITLRCCVTGYFQQANIDAICPKADAGDCLKASKTLQINVKKLINILGSLEARREKKAAVTSFARERDERHVQLFIIITVSFDSFDFLNCCVVSFPFQPRNARS